MTIWKCVTKENGKKFHPKVFTGEKETSENMKNDSGLQLHLEIAMQLLNFK